MFLNFLSKKLHAGVVFVVLLLIAITPVSAAFPDTANHRYSDAINFIQELDIVDGYPDGTFRPDRTMNRAELLTIVIGSRFENLPYKNCFSDIKSTEWYASYVCKAKELGYVSGYPDGSYRPAQDVNFVEALLILQRVYGVDVQTVDGPLWFENSVRTASEMNIIPNDNLSFAMFLTRGQMAEMITRMIRFQEGTLNEYLGENDTPVTFEELEALPTPPPTTTPVVPTPPSPTTTPVVPTTPSPPSTPVALPTTAPTANAADITLLEVTNDQGIARNELAFSSVPIAKSLNLSNTNNLYVANASGNKIDAQFKVVSRWGGGPNDTSKPIRWVETAFVANPNANSVQYYSLRNASSSAGAANLVSGTGRNLTINTGTATFNIDGNKVGIFNSIVVGGRTVYADSPAAGPRVVDGTRTLTARVDTNGFVLEQNGPVKAVIRSSGHFTESSATCTNPLAYDMRMTFVRGTSNVNIEFDIRNECGDGFDLDWQGNRHLINQVRWDFPMSLDTSSRRSIVATQSNVYTSEAGFNGETQIQQRIGSTGTSGWRRAEVTRGGSSLNTSAAYTKPFLALSDANYSAAITMPWMQWREPQALASSGNTLQLKFMSEENAVGEAQARWNFAQLRFFGGAPSNGTVESERDQGVAAVERGLLVHAPVSYINTTRVMPRLPEATGSTILNKYVSSITTLHNDTVSRQWQDNKIYGITWPDPPFFSSQNRTPADHALGSNYWSPTSSELLEYFRTGDPKWYWDFAFPQEQTFLKQIVYNLGTRTSPNDLRSGFGVGIGASEPYGAAYRQINSSDDYFYNQGSDEFYIIRPDKSIQDVFTRGCQTFINRYNSPRNQGEQYTSRLEILRQITQQVNALRYGAEFTEDSTISTQCNNKLRAVMQEFSEDNFKGGIVCTDDSGNEGSCTSDESFMYTALHLDLMMGYLYNYGDHTVTASGNTVSNVIRRAIVETAKAYYDNLVTRNGSAINVSGDWKTALQCTFSQGGTQINNCNGILFEEPFYDNARSQALGAMLIGHQLDPKYNLCDVSSTALSQSLDGEFKDYANSGGGWSKGPAQMMHNIAFGAGIAETCPNAGTINATAAPVAPATPVANNNANDALPTPADTTPETPAAPTPPPETPPAPTPPPATPAPTAGIPTSTYTLAGGETVDFYQGEGNYHAVMSHTIGTGTCSGNDFVKYDWYLAPAGSSGFTKIGSSNESEQAQLSGGHVFESQGCNKGTFLMTFNLPAGTHNAGVCITNTRNTQQRYCTTESFSL